METAATFTPGSLRGSGRGCRRSRLWFWPDPGGRGGGGAGVVGVEAHYFRFFGAQAGLVGDDFDGAADLLDDFVGELAYGDVVAGAEKVVAVRSGSKSTTRRRSRSTRIVP